LFTKLAIKHELYLCFEISLNAENISFGANTHTHDDICTTYQLICQ